MHTVHSIFRCPNKGRYNPYTLFLLLKSAAEPVHSIFRCPNKGSPHRRIFCKKINGFAPREAFFLFRAALTKSLTSYFAYAVINCASFLNNDPRRPFGQKRRVFSTHHQTPDSSSKPRHARNLSLIRASTDGGEQARSIRSARTCGKDDTLQS